MMHLLSTILFLGHISNLCLSHSVKHTNIIIIGGTGDLARKYLWQSFFDLYLKSWNENNTFTFYGSVRIEYDTGRKILNEILDTSIKCPEKAENCEKMKDQFLKITDYFQLKTEDHYKNFCEKLRKKKSEIDSEHIDYGQIFYLSIPPKAYEETAKRISENCKSNSGATWTRLVLEKPFGSDKDSAIEQAKGISKYFPDSDIYRVDHYLGKSVVKQILAFRNANRDVLESLLNNQYVDRVEVVMKEAIGVKGRIDFYDNYGVIRDVMQNHLTELLTLVTMELPANISSSKHIEKNRLKLLKQVRPVRKESALIGQYLQYIEESKLEKENTTASKYTPTFAASLLHIQSNRWRGVPFLLLSGKKLDERSSYIRILFREREFCVSGCFYGNSTHMKYPRQIVFQIGHGLLPSAGILVSKSLFEPVWSRGLNSLSITSKDSSIHGQNPGDFYYGIPVSDKPAYQTVVEDLYLGKSESFVTTERLLALWDIWSPLLDESRFQLPKIYQEASDPSLNFFVNEYQLLYTNEIEPDTASTGMEDTGSIFEEIPMYNIPGTFRNSRLVCHDKKMLFSKLAAHLKDSADRCIKERNVFHLALSGGRTPLDFYKILLHEVPEFPWQHTHVWQVDERCTSHDSDNSNFRSMYENLLKHTDIPYFNIHPMPVEVAGRICQHKDKGDKLYEDKIKHVIEHSKFDFIILGVGTDGHTASLFPLDSALKVKSGFVAYTRTSEKLVNQRMSLLYPAINFSREIIILITGKEKHELLRKISDLNGFKADDYPILGVHPVDGNITWYIDYNAFLEETLR